MKIAVIGGGLFGSIIALKLQTDGHEVVVYDRDEELAGSKPAACLIKPSWCASMSADMYEPAMALLKDLYGVEDIRMQLPVGSCLVHWVNPDKILGRCEDAPKLNRVYGNITSIEEAPQGWFVGGHGETGCAAANLPHFDAVVVAAGIWSSELMKEAAGQVAKRGAAFIFESGPSVEPRITPWAPYKQMVRFEIRPGETWIGDGSAINDKNWDLPRRQAIQDRCTGFAQGRSLKQTIEGIRPYCDDKNGIIKEVSHRLWLATGGGKNGTVLAAWAAVKISKEIGHANS